MSIFSKLNSAAWTELALLFCLISCTDSKVDEEDRTETRAPAEDLRRPTLAEHMATHVTYGTRMRDALIEGDLEGLRRYARWVAEHKSEKALSANWLQHVQAMQDAAKRAQDADDLAGAAKHVAELAAACGSCHSILGGPTRPNLSEPPAVGASVRSNMLRHQWAAATMWEALTTPSDEAWQRAVGVMVDAPLVPENLARLQNVEGASKAASGRPTARDVEQWSKEVHDIAKQVRDERRMRERVRAYGRLLNTCSTCHNALRKGDPTTPARVK